MSKTAAETSDLDLTTALENGQFESFYQPQIDVATGQIVGAEAVARWRHPRLGLLKPNLFLDHVRQRGRFSDFSRAIVARAIKECANWRKGKNKLSLTVSINVSGTDLADPDFICFLTDQLKSAKLSAQHIILEVPELDLSGRDREAISISLLALRTLGCGIAMEARGPIFNPEDGSNLPLTQLKIGGAAILRFASAFQDARIGVIHRRLEWARAHNLQTVAVGAESASALRALASLGFDRVQCDYLASAAERKVLNDAIRTDYKGRIDSAIRGTDLFPTHSAPEMAQTARPTAQAATPEYTPPRRTFGGKALALKSVDTDE